MPAAWLLVWFLVLPWGPPWAAAADLPAGGEELHYRVSLGVFENVARVRLSLKPQGTGRYLAEVFVTPQGSWGFLRRWLPERYQTEMSNHQGRWQPLVFREVLLSGGKKIRKEYRFDYQEGRLEFWRGEEGQVPVKKWQVPLKEPVYDPLTLFYTLRPGGGDSSPGGATLRVLAIPTPAPELVEMKIQFGPENPQGRQITVNVTEKASGRERGPYYFRFNNDHMPYQGWTQVFPLGKLMMHLLPGEALKADQPALPRGVDKGSK